MENEIRIKIGDVEFQAKGEDAIIARERASFFENVLPLLSGKKTLHSPHFNEDKQQQAEDDPPQTEKDSPVGVQTKKVKKVKSFTPQLDKSLDLRGTDKIKSFKAFYEEKMPKTNIHITTVAVYYLNKIMNYEKIDVNAIYTCYKELPVKVPENIVQNLRDTSSSKYGFIDYKDNLCSLTVRGENVVEKDLPESK